MSLFVGLIVSAIPEVVEAAAAFGEAVAELTGSTYAGAAADYGAQRGINSVIDDKVRALVDSIFGQGFYDSVNRKIDDVEKIALGGFAMSKNDPLGLSAYEDLMGLPHKGEKAKGKQGLNPKDAARFAHRMAEELSKDPGFSVIEQRFEPSVLNKALESIINSDPQMKEMVLPLVYHLSNYVVPTNEDYRRIASVYNGDFEPNSAFETPNAFQIIDETGTINTWQKEWSGQYVQVPPLYGIWTGISSPNDSLPQPVINGQRSYLDSVSMMHDIDYHHTNHSSFSYFSDMKMISRLSQNKDRLTQPNELFYASVAINYFATLGSITRVLLGEPHLTVEQAADLERKGFEKIADLLGVHRRTSNVSHIIDNLQIVADKAQFNKDYLEEVGRLVDERANDPVVAMERIIDGFEIDID